MIKDGLADFLVENLKLDEVPEVNNSSMSVKIPKTSFAYLTGKTAIDSSIRRFYGEEKVNLNIIKKDNAYFVKFY
jgi:hypothetical protein